ncbi:hypothetical protein ABIC20_003838 [Methylobacterium radiotolerans]|uniref:Uncharacterized protein n=1 Tax=Methylobacterium radiotolerans TaxID=31998 RepID=A0ABV2NJ43_9HYPH
MALLVEFPVVRQECLRDDAEQAAALDGERAVVDAVSPAQGRADEQQRPEIGRFGDHPGCGGLDRVEQRLLQEQVLDRVGREAELGEDRQRRPRIVAGPGEVEDDVGVALGLGRMAAAGAGRDPGETVAIEGAEARRRFGGGWRHGHLSG